MNLWEHITMFKPATTYRRLCVQSFCNVCFCSRPLRLYLDLSEADFETYFLQLVMGVLIFMGASVPLALFYSLYF